jgi:hypothetical protein
MDKRLQQAFEAIGIKNPIELVQETIDRLNKIETARKKEQEMSKALMSPTISILLSQTLGFLESIK